MDQTCPLGYSNGITDTNEFKLITVVLCFIETSSWERKLKNDKRTGVTGGGGYQRVLLTEVQF